MSPMAHEAGVRVGIKINWPLARLYKAVGFLSLLLRTGLCYSRINWLLLLSLYNALRYIFSRL